MSKTSKLSKCKRCSTELDNGVCPSCSSVAQPFGIPDYINIQIEEARNNASAVHGKAKNKIDEALKTITEDHYKLLCSDLTDVERIAAMKDAHDVLKHALVSDCDFETLSTLCKIGKVIGDLSTSINLYIQSGGKKCVTKTRSQKSLKN